MAETANWGDFSFFSAPSMNAAFEQPTASVEDVTGSLFTPGLVNAPEITFVGSGLSVITTFGSTARVLFGSGVLAGGYGTVNGATSGVYPLDLTYYVPFTGSVTVYIAAEATQIGQQGSLVTGPSPGHPDFDPEFAPYTSYAETQDSVSLLVLESVPDNITNIELCRVAITAGETNITSVNTSFQVNTVAILSQTGYPLGITSVNTSGSIAAALTGRTIEVGGSATTQTIAGSGWVAGNTIGFFAAFPCTVDITGGALFVGQGMFNATSSVAMPAESAFLAQFDGGNWVILSASPVFAGFSSAVGTSGYTKTPYQDSVLGSIEVIEQNFMASLTSNTDTYPTLPIAMPNAITAVMISYDASLPPTVGNCGVDLVGATLDTVHCYNTASSTNEVNIWVKGY